MGNMYQWNPDIYSNNGSIGRWNRVPGDQWTNANMRDRLCGFMGSLFRLFPDIYNNNGCFRWWC